MDFLIWEWRNSEQPIDYCRVSFLVPLIGIRRGRERISDQKWVWVGFMGKTEFSYEAESEVDWRFSIRVLGFGFSIHRQWGF
jgi:hypothetical protein